MWPPTFEAEAKAQADAVARAQAVWRYLIIFNLDSKNGLMKFFTVNRDLNWEALAQEQGITVPPEAGDMLKMAGNYLYTPKFDEWKLKIMGFQR